MKQQNQALAKLLFKHIFVRKTFKPRIVYTSTKVQANPWKRKVSPCLNIHYILENIFEVTPILFANISSSQSVEPKNLERF